MQRILIAVCILAGLGASALAQEGAEPRRDAAPRVERERDAGPPPRAQRDGPRERWFERRGGRGEAPQVEGRRRARGDDRQRVDRAPWAGRGAMLRRMWLRRAMAERMRGRMGPDGERGRPFGPRAERSRRGGVLMAPRFEGRRGPIAPRFEGRRGPIAPRFEGRRGPIAPRFEGRRGPIAPQFEGPPGAGGGRAPVPPRFDRKAIRERIELWRERTAPRAQRESMPERDAPRRPRRER